MIGGLAVWRDKMKAPASGRQIRDIEADIDAFRSAHFRSEDIRQIPITQILAALLQWFGRPIPVDALASIVRQLLDVKDYTNAPLYEDMNEMIEALLDASTLEADSALEARELLSQLWTVVRDLPPTQRDTYCLGFEDETGADLFSLLLETEVVTLPQLSQALGRSLEQITGLRSRMPMDSSLIAKELNASRAQVIKWRFRALHRLKEELLRERK